MAGLRINLDADLTRFTQLVKANTEGKSGIRKIVYRFT